MQSPIMMMAQDVLDSLANSDKDEDVVVDGSQCLSSMKAVSSIEI